MPRVREKYHRKNKHGADIIIITLSFVGMLYGAAWCGIYSCWPDRSSNFRFFFCCFFFLSMNDFHSTCNTHKAFWLYCLKNHFHYNNNAVNSFCVCVCVSFPLTRRNEWRRQPLQSIDNLNTKIKKEKGVVENLKRRFIFFFSDVFHRCRRLWVTAGSESLSQNHIHLSFMNNNSFPVDMPLPFSILYSEYSSNATRPLYVTI